MLFLKVFSYAQCTVNSLYLNTGYNHATNTLYGTSIKDEYWRVVQGPTSHGPYPFCAWSLGGCCGGIPGIPALTSTTISVMPLPTDLTDGNLKKGVNNCNYDDAPYIFERDFKIANNSSPTFSIEIPNIYGDLNISKITLISPSTATTLLNSCLPQILNGTSLGSFTGIPTEIGKYTLRIEMGNDWQNAGSWLNPNWIGTALRLQIYAKVYAQNNIFVDNKHFGKNSICSPAYVNIEEPTFGNQCLSSTSGPITITNFNSSPTLTYTVNGGTVSSTGVFNGIVGNTYTVTVTDGTGCIVTNSITVVSNNLQVTLNDWPSNTPATLKCVPLLYTANNIVPVTTNGTAPYSISAPTSTSPHPYNSGTLYNGLHFPVGTHIITVTDANMCSKSVTYSVGNLFTLSNNATPPCANPGLINPIISPSIITSGIKYKINNGIYTNSIPLSIGIGGAGTYTITAKDDYGCTATSTQTMFPNPVITTTTNYNTCPPIVTANPSGLVSYQWSAPFNNTPSTSNTTSTTSTILNLPNGTTTYSVIATDNNGCTGISTNTYVINPFCCLVSSYCPTREWFPNAWDEASAKKFSNLWPYTNNNSTALLQSFGNPAGNIISTNDKIIIDGTMLINQNITFLNCPNIFFTYNGKIEVSNYATLTFQNCKIRSLCHTSWDGIYATGNGIGTLTNNARLNIINSEFKDMRNGINVISGAILNCNNNYFKNNEIGIQISNSPVGYNYINGNCVIINNYFMEELYPCGSLNNIGIKVKNCKEVAIGVLDLATKTNYFKSLKYGIYITSSIPNQKENYYVYDNQFENILPALTTSTFTNGYAIYAECTPTNSAFHTLYVKNTFENVSNIPRFINCNYSVYTKYVSANIQETRSIDCTNGFVFDNALNQIYRILNNTIYGNTMLGMSFNGNTNSQSLVEFNSIQLSSTPLGVNFPSGIKVNYNAPNISNGITFNYNNVDIRANAGTGFSLLNTNANTLLYYNTVNNTNLTPSPLNNGGVNFSSPNSAHYDVSNCKGTRLIENRSNGSNLLLTNGVNNVEGMRITNSNSCEFSCNRFNKTRIGTMVIGNCLGTIFRGNKYNSHGNSLRFQDLGGGASIGDIGTSITNNNNQFTSGSLFTIPFNFTLFRFASSAAPSIFTNATITSGSNTSTGSYLIAQLSNGANIYNQCTQTPNFVSTSSGSSMYTETDAVEIANSTGQYAEFGEVAKWIEDGRLYCEIANGDFNLLNNPTVLDFYANQQLSFRDELYLVDRMISELSDSVSMEDTTLTLQEKIQPIETLNNTIVSTNDLEKDEQFINKLYLQWLKGGVEKIDSTDSIALEIMAWSCPMEKGTAVYKARCIYASINPSCTFDDIALCITGLNKNNTQQDANIDMNMVNNLFADDISIYPNPAVNEVTIDYVLPENTQGKIIIFDMLGRARMNIDLSATNNRTTFSVAQIEKGIYVYKYVVNNKVIKTDKLTVK